MHARTCWRLHVLTYAPVLRSVPSCFYIALSCLIAVSVNFSTFLVIGKCDAVTYQVLGHLKTVLILVLGFVMLKNPANPRAVSGIAIAMVGMVAYAHEEGKAAAAPAAQLEKQQQEAAGGVAGTLPEKRDSANVELVDLPKAGPKARESQ